MTRERFTALLDKATEQSCSVAGGLVVETLPADFRYLLLDARGKPAGVRLTREQIVTLNWDSGRVPRWIDVGVVRCDELITDVGLLVSDDRVAAEEECVYFSRGLGPFGVKSPVLPVDWVSVESSGRFSLSR